MYPACKFYFSTIFCCQYIVFRPILGPFYPLFTPCDVISNVLKFTLFCFSNTKFSYSRKTVLQCWYLNLISLLYEYLGLFGYFGYPWDLWRHWGINIVHIKIWLTPLNLSRFNYHKCKLTLKMGMISSISGNPIILVYIGII